jgi:hypothetical protein
MERQSQGKVQGVGYRGGCQPLSIKSRYIVQQSVDMDWAGVRDRGSDKLKPQMIHLCSKLGCFCLAHDEAPHATALAMLRLNASSLNLAMMLAPCRPSGALAMASISDASSTPSLLARIE